MFVIFGVLGKVGGVIVRVLCNVGWFVCVVVCYVW